MACIDWSDGLEVGVDAIDREHRVLIDAVNELQAGLEAGEPTSQLIVRVARVAREGRAHFISEEAAMETSGYPGAALHALKHQHIASQIDSFLIRYSRDTTSLNAHLLNFVRDTLALHIRREDVNFGRWMLDREAREREAHG